MPFIWPPVDFGATPAWTDASNAQEKGLRLFLSALLFEEIKSKVDVKADGLQPPHQHPTSDGRVFLYSRSFPPRALLPQQPSQIHLWKPGFLHPKYKFHSSCPQWGVHSSLSSVLTPSSQFQFMSYEVSYIPGSSSCSTLIGPEMSGFPLPLSQIF